MRTSLLPPRTFLYGRGCGREVFWVHLQGGCRTILFYGHPVELEIPEHNLVVEQDTTTRLCTLYALADLAYLGLRVSPLPNVRVPECRACTPAQKSPWKQIDVFLQGDFNLEIDKGEAWNPVEIRGVDDWAAKTREGYDFEWDKLPPATIATEYVYPPGVRWMRIDASEQPSLVWRHSAGEVTIRFRPNVAELVSYVPRYTYVDLEVTKGKPGWGRLARLKGDGRPRRQRTVWEWAQLAAKGLL